MKKYLVEFIGTFFLVLVIGLAGNPLAIGGILICLVYMGGHISGAHYNPAVTLAVWMRKKIEAKDAMMYMAVQLLGAMAAAICFHMIYGKLKTFAPAPSNMSINILKPLFVETVFTFALVMVVLNVALAKRTSGNDYYGLAIGLTVMGAAYAGGDISGGAFNPAVGLGPLIIDTINGGSNLGHAWLYIAGPFIGGAAASMIFGWLEDEAVA
jgi:aquaporin Z